jgi:hypothetical protein
VITQRMRSQDISSKYETLPLKTSSATHESRDLLGRRTLPLRRVGFEKGYEDGTILDGPKVKWKSDVEVVKAPIRFLEKTGRLTYQPEAQ